MCKRWIYPILLYCWVVYVSQCIFICFCFPCLSFVDYSEQDCSLMYCACFLYLLSLCVVCHYTAYTLSFLLFCTLLCLVSFTCIIVVFSLLFFVRIYFYIYGLSTVGCSSLYLCVALCVFVLLLDFMFFDKIRGHLVILLFYRAQTRDSEGLLQK